METNVAVRTGTWRSGLLDCEAHLALHGHAGPVVVALPTGSGGIDEWVAHGAVAALYPALAAGRIRLCRVGFGEPDPWRADGLEPTERARRSTLLERCILEEVVPRAAGDAPLVLAGAELGGLHAISAALMRPDRVRAVLALDPLLDPAAGLGLLASAETHALDPAARVMLEDDPDRIARLCDLAILIAVGVAMAQERRAAERLIDALEARGIDTLLRIWDDRASGWTTWLARLKTYLGDGQWTASLGGPGPV